MTYATDLSMFNRGEGLMKSQDRFIYIVFFLLTALLVVFNVVFGRSDATKILVFATRASLFAVALLSRKKYFEQKMLTVAFGLSLFSDFFFVFIKMSVFKLSSPWFDLAGIVGFIGAYLLLSIIFSRNVKIRQLDLVVATPFVIVFSIVLFALIEYASGFLMAAALVLGCILCYMGMTMIASIYRGYFTKQSAVLIAIAGVTLYVSDMFVAFSMFHPDYQDFVLWMQNIIGITYMIGWTILLYLVRKSNLIDNS